MDDFTDFESVPSATQPSVGAVGVDAGFDPDNAMTDFLAREAAMKQELGAVDDGDMFGAPVAVAANDFAIPAAADDFGGFDASEPASFGETGGDVAFEAAAATPVDAVTGSMAAMSTASVVLSSAKSTNALAPDVDSDAVRKWRTERDAKIAEQDRQSALKHDATIKKAHKEIDQFYEEYNQKKAKQIARNRELEKASKKNKDDEGKTVPNVWERVVNQVDLNATASKGKTTADKADKSAGAAASSAAVPTIPAVDKSRFKSMLMQLKNDAKAPGNQPVTAQ